MRRRSNSFSDHILYPKTTQYLRVAQMILCIVCLGLAFYFWSSENTLLGATVVLFATSFGFLFITVVDVFASLKHRQYTSPAWVGIAFLAAFMFFLSFGFMIPLTVILHIVIGVIFGVTGLVFLIDGIHILLTIYQSHVFKKVHPIEDVGETTEQPSKIEDEVELFEEVPVELRTYQPVAGAPTKRSPSIKSSSRSPYPITSYGGTFPVGASDEPPLPTPVKLTGQYPTNKQTQVEGSRNLYPVVTQEDNIIEEFIIPEEANQTQIEPEVNRQFRNLQDDELYPRGDIVARAPYRAAGDNQDAMNMGRIPIESRFQQNLIATDGHVCHCCGTRVIVHEPREQITPYVTHHYKQSPCACGYTHYQASTVVKGAVKQYPQDSVKQQQRMIREQLDQMKDDHSYNACSCHDKPTKEKNVPYIHLVRDSPSMEDMRGSRTPDYRYTGYEELDSTFLNKDTTSPNKGFDMEDPVRLSSKLSRSLTGLNVEDRSMHRRVTIGTMDVIAPSDASSDQFSGSMQQKERLSLNNDPNRKRYSDDPNFNSNQPKKSSLKRQNDFLLNEAPNSNNLNAPTTEGLRKYSWEASQNDNPYYVGDLIGNMDRSLRNEFVEESPRLTLESVKQEATNAEPLREVARTKDLSTETFLNMNLETFTSRIEEDETQRPNVYVTKERDPYPENAPVYSQRKSLLGDKEVIDSYSLIANQNKTPRDDLGVHTNQRSSLNSRRHSYDESTNTPRTEQSYSREPYVEGTYFDDREKTWRSEAQEAHRSLIASLPSNEPRKVCRGPSDCFCCPNSRREAEKAKMMSTRDNRRQSNARKKTSVTRSTNDVPVEPQEKNQVRRITEVFPKDRSDKRSSITSDNSKIVGNTKENVVLPRMLDPIEEQRKRDNVHLSDSEERISHIPPYHDGFPRDVMMFKQTSCICKCVCVPPRRESKTRENIRRYETVPLNEKPYHPKDDFKMPRNSFSKFSAIQEALEDTTGVDNQRRILNEDAASQTLRSPVLERRLPSNTLNCLDECPDCLSRSSKECPEECSSCPVRRQRLMREARLRQEAELLDSLSVSRRSLKRAHPDGRR